MNLCSFIIILIVLSDTKGHIKHIKTENATISNSLSCINAITEFVVKRKIDLKFSEIDKEFASEIIKKIKKPLLINVTETRVPFGIERRLSNDLVFLINDFEPNKIFNETLWNENTLFIIIHYDLRVIQTYFNIFWTLKILNVFGMKINEEKNILYTYLPFNKKSCEYVDLKIIDTCQDGNFYNDLKFLHKRIMKNMNGCSVNISLTEAKPFVMIETDGDQEKNITCKGFEVSLIAEIAKIYNFKPFYKHPSDGIGWGWIHPTPHGTIGDLYKGISDIGVGILGPLLERYENLDFSAFYFLDMCNTFGLPQGSGRKKAAWIILFFMEFHTTTWILIFMSFVLTGIVAWLFNKLSNTKLLASKTELIMILFLSFLGSQIKIPSSISFKTAMLQWIFYSFILTTAYKASMGSKLSVPLRDPDINTYSELIQSDLELTGYKNMLQVLASSNSSVFKTMRKRFKVVNETIESVVDRMARGEKIAHIRHSATFYYFARINPKARGRIHMLRDCLYQYNPLIMAKKYSPFTPNIAEAVIRLEESGILTLWRAAYTKKLPPVTKPFYKLSINQMFGIFYFLGIAYFVAFCTFLSEIFYYRYHKKGELGVNHCISKVF